MIWVLYFGRAADISGTHAEEFSAENTARLLEIITMKHPGLRNIVFRLALNGSLLNEDRDLKDGDRVAVLPPFSGG